MGPWCFTLTFGAHLKSEDCWGKSTVYKRLRLLLLDYRSSQCRAAGCSGGMKVHFRHRIFTIEMLTLLTILYVSLKASPIRSFLSFSISVKLVGKSFASTQCIIDIDSLVYIWTSKCIMSTKAEKEEWNNSYTSVKAFRFVCKVTFTTSKGFTTTASVNPDPKPATANA